MATSSKDAAANDGTAGGDSGADTPTGVPEMATSSGPVKDAAANDGTAGGVSGAHTSTGAPETSTSTGYDYEVFLSFRGPDTRAAFTDYLYTTLTDRGIRTFKDDEHLRIGEEFGPELLQAIKQSKILVPIFSKNYATSVWCLKEVAQMVECKKTGGQKIVPIFYDVEPAEVRHQTGGYKDAFLLHESKTRHDGKKRYDQKTIGEWKAALSAVGAINGWDLHKEGENRREGEFVRNFTREVFNELKKASLAVSNYFVCVDNHVDAIMEKIGDGTSGTRIIGIHGMGGIGKTTIAKIIFNKFADDFENCCFLCDIRETSKTRGIQCLQKQLISSILKVECADIKDIHEGTQTIENKLSNKRVLILLDDVEKANHIEALVCKRWLGEGSKIIITSRRIDILNVPEVDWRYELTGMDLNQSLQLFSRHAFRRDSPLDEYVNQSNRAIKIAGGLPLAIEVMGSLLSRIEKEKWDHILTKLANVPDAEVQKKLKISYDALEDQAKRTFLDIACLFIGYDKDILVHFWDEPNFSPIVAMEDLQNMSLIKITEDNKVRMHDQLRDLGREMVRQESQREVKKQSRVWDHEQGSDLLRKHKGKKEIEALRLKLEHQPQYHFTYEGFESLSDLRFLEVDGRRKNFRIEDRLLWHKSPPNVLPSNENPNLLPNLRWLSWSDFPSTFNIANFSLEDVVILNLSKSVITDDWEGWSHMEMMKKLKVLNLSGCYKLRRLPNELGRDLASLEYLSLEYCERLKRLPDSIENMKSLIELDISGTGIRELPNSIKNLKNLKRLKMRWCEKIRKIPDALWTIEKLEEMEVSKDLYPSKYFHVKVGNCISKNQSLRILKLNVAKIYALPWLPESLVILKLEWLCMVTFPDLSNLANLKELDLEFMSLDSDGEYRERPLEENPILSSPHVSTSPTNLTLPPQLNKLHLCGCPSNPRRLGRLPSTLSSLHLEWCHSLRSMEDLSNLKNLSYLVIWDVAIEQIQDLGCLENLRELKLIWLERLKLLPNLRNLNKLRSLDVSYCRELVGIQGELPESLEELKLQGCDSLEFLDPSSPYVTTSSTDLTLLPPHLKKLELYSCPKLRRLPKLPSTLSSLTLSCCESLCLMEDLSNLKNLSSLWIMQVAIEEIQGLGCLENLQHLYLSSLGLVKTLPNLSNLNKLRRLNVLRCDDLAVIQGELPESLEELKIDRYESLQKLPDLSSWRELCGGVWINSRLSLNSEGEDDEYESEYEGEDSEHEHESEGERRRI